MTATEPDIIIAVASAPGAGRRGIVRLSGAGVLAAFGANIELGPLAAGASTAAPAAATAVGLADASRGLWRARLRGLPGVPASLPGLVMVLRGPASYTGEDGLELFLPGSPPLLRAVVDGLLASARARGVDAGPAGPGAFTARAWRNGRLDLIEAEGVAAVIAASDEADLRAARGLVGGPFVAAVAAVADELAALLAAVEAGIDFADEEDVVIVAAGRAAARLDAVAARVAAMAAAGGAGEAASGLPRVVLTGPPNAGKSTLFNAILGEEATLASPALGTTRDAIERVVEVGGHRVVLIDTAGLEGGDTDGHEADDARIASGPAAAAAQRRAWEVVAAADVRLVCVPADQPVTGPWIADVNPGGARGGAPGAAAVLVLRTMVDRLGPASDRRRGFDHALGDAWISGQDGEGLDALPRLIAAVLDRRGAEAGGIGALITRHRAAMDAAAAALDEARTIVAGDRQAAPEASVRHPEMLAAALRIALDELGSVSGVHTPDDVLGRIFSSFCIGK
jgi:tRNA modification GTPase